jgi:two-component system cell cycle sensor histidine kinase/response regulator CckA
MDPPSSQEHRNSVHRSGDLSIRVFCHTSDSGLGGVSATILVVDDDTVTLTLVERTLGAKGYRVWTAGSAAEARQLLQELAGAVDLVLTDVSMPGELGTDLARQIGSDQRWVRVLLMSSYSREDLLGQGLDVPEPHLLQKPFAPAQLLSRIGEALGT